MFSSGANEKTSILTGIILAGGSSKRMGTDKAKVRLNGKKLIEFPIKNLSRIVDEIIVVGREEVDIPGVRAYPDIMPGCGPLGGIYTGLMLSAAQLNLVLACDMPFVTFEFLKLLLSNLGSHDIVMARRAGRLEPVCGAYRKACAGQMLKLMENGKLKLQNIPRYFRVKILNLQSRRTLFSVNTPADLKMAERWMKHDH